MKKILFTLLLFTGFLQAQTYPANPTKFGKISLNTNGVSTSTSKINTQEADGQINYIDAENLPVSTATQIAIDGKVSDTIRDGINAIAPSENAVYDALKLKENISNKATDFATVNNTLYPTVQATKTYADNLVVGLLNDRGSYDASSNLYPSTGGSGSGGIILKGNIWSVTVPGVLGGVSVGVGDWIRALVNSPGQTSSNWAVVEGNFGYVPENVANKSSSYTLTSTTTYPDTKALVDGLATKQNTLTNPVTGTGTANYLPKFTASGVLGTSSFYDGIIRYGIGSIPDSQSTLYVKGSNALALTLVDDRGNSSSGGSGILALNNARMVNGSRLGYMVFGGKTDTDVIINSSGINSYSTGVWTNSSRPSNLIFETTGNTGVRVGRMTIDSSGEVLIGTSVNDGVNKLQVTGGGKIDLLDLSGTPDTSFTASHYYVETATDGKVRPKTLANVQSEIVTSAAIDAASVQSGTITTATNITNATLTDTSLPQKGKTLLISNGATNINYTINGSITASFVKGGTGSITFIQGSGRTMVAANGTLVFNGAQYSTASVVSFGTTDIVYINNF